jgi:hypothetical protein
MTKEQTNQLKLVSLIGELMGALSGSNFWINEESVKNSNIELVDRARKITNDVIDNSYDSEGEGITLIEPKTKRPVLTKLMNGVEC